MRRQGLASPSVFGRGRWSFAVVLFVFAFASPVGASAATGLKPTVGVPSCSRISRTAMAKLVGTGPLTLTRMIGNLCTFTGQISGHYKPNLVLQIVPYSSSLWASIEGSDRNSARAEGSTFDVSNPKLFFVSGERTSQGLPTCTSHVPLAYIAGPACAGEPTMTSFEAVGYGSYKGGGLKVIVSASATGEQGDTHLSRVIALVTQILSGKIAAQ